MRTEEIFDHNTPIVPPVPTRKSARWPIAVWICSLIIGIILISRASFTADLSAFLPSSPTPEQALLVEQLRDGMVSRLILVGIEGSDASGRAELSKALAKRLRAHDGFMSVNNGEPVSEDKDRAYLFNNRYLLSPTVTPERFTESGLRDALNETLDLLASPAGMLVKDLLTQDPTGEMVALLGQFQSAQQPRKVDGVWAAADGRRSLLLAQTKAIGSDTDGQEKAIAEIRKQFELAKSGLAAQLPAIADAGLVLTGPGVFGVNARNTIVEESSRLAIISSVLIMSLLFLVYRSGVAVVLGLLPVLSGVLAGIVAVSLGFGVVHGITIGFGTTLIGEAADYSIYLFIQSEKGGQPQQWIEKFWPTIRLGALTSTVGFSALLFSGFPGLAQLGLYSIAGLIAAACMTRFVLPLLLPVNFAVRDVSFIGVPVQRALRHAHRLRYLVFVLVLLACAILWVKRDNLWHPDLNALSPVSESDQQLDASLRKDIGAPDVRYLVVVKAATIEDVLRDTELVSAQLNALVEQGVLAAYESPSRYLPSQHTQKLRLDSLPDAAVLRERLENAAQGMPLKPGIMAPFVASVDQLHAAARNPAVADGLLLTRESLQGTSMALATESLLIQKDDVATGLMPLTAPASHIINPLNMRQALEKSGVKQAYFVDLKTETDKLYRDYLSEAIILSLCGVLAIVILLALNLRSARRVWSIMLPLFAAVLVVAAMLAIFGQRMTILHLIGLLLIVAGGSNYALFFNEADGDGGEAGDSESGTAIKPTTLASMVMANVTTVMGFGLLAFSSVPVLNAIGQTVGPGAVLALLFSAALANNSGRNLKPSV